MLSPSDFSLQQAHDDCELSVNKLTIDENSHCGLKIPMRYTDDWQISLNLSEFFSIEASRSLAFKGADDPAINLTIGNKCFEVFLTTKKSSFSGDKRTILATPSQEPIVFDYEDQYTSLEAVVLAPPLLHEAEVTLQDVNGRKFTLIPSCGIDGHHLSLKLIASGHTKDAVEDLDDLIEFMTFMAGSYCGIGNAVMTSDAEKVTGGVLGFTRTDVQKKQTNWFDLEIQPSLPEIFLKFSAARKCQVTRQAIMQTVGFYRASNASRPVSIELSIIAAHTALEAAVNFILEHMAGWSKTLATDRKIRFSDKMRAAAGYLGIERKIDNNSPTITALIKATGNVGDAYEALSFIRNKLVHQDASYTPDGVQLHEAWLLMQWLVEVLTFGIIGYRGKIIDRRIYQGRRGTIYQLDFRP